MDLVPQAPLRATSDASSPPIPAGPFTPAMAARAGIGRSGLERWWRTGRVVRIVRGVYVDAATPSTPVLRAQALALVVGRRQVVVDRTAAWVYGAEPLQTDQEDAVPLDVHGRRLRVGGQVPYHPDELVVIEGLRCTTALRTALDVGRHLNPDRALVALDGLLRAGAVRHPDLIAATAGCRGLPGALQLRELAARADGRAADPAESLLRMRWLETRVPTPVPGLRFAGARLALSLPVHRFAVTITGTLTPAELTECTLLGWRVVQLDRQRLLASDPSSVSIHVEREYHRHLLHEVGHSA
ncbi:MAG: hypothetical protein JWP74_3109 [Marmoricola sp.]|nr:hypothetical protein [Marmoricola sp.]